MLGRTGRNVDLEACCIPLRAGRDGGRRGGGRTRRTGDGGGPFRPAPHRPCAAAVGGRAARVRPEVVRGHPPAFGAGRAARRWCLLHRSVHAAAVRLVPRHGRPGHRRQPGHHRRLLRRHVEPGAAAGRDHGLQGRRARRGGLLHRGRRQEPGRPRRRAGPPEPAGRHHGHDRHPAHAAQPGQAAGRPADVQAGLPALLPQGEHGLRGRPQARAADGLVRQAPGLRHPQRPVRRRDRRPVHARDQQQGARRVRLDEGQRRHPAVRRVQGPGGPQRDRRLRPRPPHPDRDPGRVSA